ncbi:hypothetical protein BFW88_12795 [Pseudomonas fluorescens]|nr:hypothetical protein BFW88_12795 [Pseudomonas fluorescens]OPB10493.1 hypothetical protein BFW92_12990 [Pseudomonas fluorescens]OPB21747.1 hypothetical protein BFW93_12780 [Pseudomonas fluorescens]
MSSTPATAPAITMTPVEEGVFFNLVKRQAPPWLSGASSQLRGDLQQSLLASYPAKARAKELLDYLPSPEQFCTPLLTDALAHALGETLDIRGVVFQHVRSQSRLFGLHRVLIEPVERDLLAAAYENFELSETEPGNYHADSCLYLPAAVTGADNRILTIKPHEFAQLCRTLDLGRQYQTCLTQWLDTGPQADDLRQRCVTYSAQRFEVQTHEALGKGHISRDVHDMLIRLRRGESPVKLGDNEMQVTRITCAGVRVHGMFVIGPATAPAEGDRRCVLYLPDDPLHPLKEYVTYLDIEAALSRRLRDPAFRDWFTGLIALKDKSVFVEKVRTDLLEHTGSPLPSESRYMTFAGEPFAGDLFSEMYRQRVDRTLADARLLVVPTDDEDEKSRLRRLDTYKAIGLNLAMLGASFIPGVGEVMLGLAALDVLTSIYHGIDSWYQGEQEQATNYLFDTLENLLLMAAVSAVGAGVAKVYRAARRSAFLDGLWLIEGKGGRQQLWKPNVAPYRQPFTLPQWVKADGRGILSYKGQDYVEIEGALYAVAPKEASTLWEIKSVGLRQGYRPLLQTNGVGAWLHDIELASQWSGLQRFRRLGYSIEDIPDETASKILAVSGIDDDRMLQSLVESTWPPALLEDTAWRFRIDARLERFIAQLATPDTAPMADPALQVQLLVSLEQWPADRAVRFFGERGESQALFAPEALAAQHQTIALTPAQLKQGGLYRVLLAGLNETQRASLLPKASRAPSEQARALAEVLATRARLGSRRQLFDWLYQRIEPQTGDVGRVLTQRYPDLPASVADELVRHADQSELTQLQQSAVPLRLDEEVRRYRQRIKGCRAFEGLYIGTSAGADTYRLVVDNMTHLVGWFNGLHLRIVEVSARGAIEVVAEAGPKLAPQLLEMRASPEGFQVFDANTDKISDLAERTSAHFFKALWQGLSPKRRKSLGRENDTEGTALAGDIIRTALLRRAYSAQGRQRDGGGVEAVSPMGLASAPRLDLLPLARAFPPVRPALPSALTRARWLYPRWSNEQLSEWLSILGADEVSVLRQLETLRLEYERLRATLLAWQTRDTWYEDAQGVRLKVATDAKAAALREIIRCWRKETPTRLTSDGVLFELKFEMRPLGDLPDLGAGFVHVGTLVMERVGCGADVDAFLRRFTKLRTLSLRGNSLVQIPAAVADMTRLQHLDLSENQIRLTPGSVNRLSGLTRLSVLNLDFNAQMDLAPTIAAMSRLEVLSLRATGISQWPAGTWGLSMLNILDLRDNRIAYIPEEVFSAPHSVNAGTYLQGNPLAQATLERMAAYRQVSGIGFGVMTPRLPTALGRFLVTREQCMAWLDRVPATDARGKRQLWDSLLAVPDASAFFEMIWHLRETADFSATYTYLRDRVWSVLHYVAEDAQLRQRVFRMSRFGNADVDQAVFQFSRIEMHTASNQALRSADDRGIPVEVTLIALLRGLFRLAAVERVALNDIGARASVEPLSQLRRLQISLAYRAGLADRLRLPLQPPDLNVDLQVDVSEAALDAAVVSVLRREQTSEFFEFIQQQELWRDYLRTYYAQHFSAVRDKAALEMARIEHQALTLSDADRYMESTMQNFRNENEALYRMLTTTALSQRLVEVLAPDLLVG